jgi:hypothetical protein
MSEPSNVENPDVEGAGANQPPVSPQKENSIAGAPQSSQEFLELKKRLDLTERELKGLQSRQDKSTNEVQRFMEDVKAHVAKGKSLDEAEQLVHADRKAAEKDDLLYQIAQKVGVLGGSPQNVAGNNSNAADEAARVLQEYDIPLNDPQAIPLLELKGVELVKAVGKLAVQRAKSQTPPDSSEAGSIKGGPPTPKPGVEKLTEQYQKDMQAAPRGPKGDAERKAIKERARKDGVPVDSIGFV